MAAISVLSAALTSRCRARVVFLSNIEETILASKDWPHPPAWGGQRNVEHVVRDLFLGGWNDVM